MAAPPDIDEAMRAAGYQIVGSPIRGGMSTVYPTKALGSGPDTPHSPADAPDTAIKVLDDLENDSARLHREAELLALLDHPAVARFIEAGELSTGVPFLASAWVPGPTLHARLIDGEPFDVDSAISVFETIAGGLQHLHDRGIVHRDLSPNNIILRADGDADRPGAATLIDFGISRGDASAFQTIGTDLAGTPRYLAPEVIGGGEPSPASDQFAAGIILYEMLTGSWPYPESPTAANALHHQLSTTPTPLIERLPDAPLALDHAIQRALQKDPAKRFPSTSEFVAAIHRPVRQRSKRPRLANVAALGVSGIIAATVLLSLIGDTNEAATPPTSLVDARAIGGDWTAGAAAALACNMLEFVDFDDRVLPRNWYLNPIEEAGVDVVESGGQDDSPAIRIGVGERYGLWGEQVSVEPGETYVFAGTFISEGDPFAASFTIEWYDAASSGLLVDNRTIDLTQVPDGRVSLTSTAPADARFAVTRVFKDSSAGSLLADEFVFANVTDPCADQL